MRRVAVTGVGLVSSVGIGTEASWRAILAGQSGIGPITAFDATEFNCRIAGQVNDFDPHKYIEKKEIKKMARFIQMGIAASECALSGSGVQVTPENAEQTGVYIGSGIGGFEIIEREHRTLLEHGPRRISPFFYSRHHHQSRLRLRLHPQRRQGTQLRHCHRLHHQRSFHRRFLQDHPAR